MHNFEHSLDRNPLQDPLIIALSYNPRSLVRYHVYLLNMCVYLSIYLDR